jgi:hypothetical protein
MPSSAHTPVSGAVHRYADNQLLTYRFNATAGNTVPGWLQTVTNAALPTQWASNNNSQAPHFQYSGSGSGMVSYTGAPFGMSNCFGQTGWIGCTTGGGSPGWQIALRSNSTVWCEQNAVTGCFYARRVLLHELEHVTLTNVEETQPATVTNMGPCEGTFCSKPRAGYDSSSPKECDQASLLMTYGAASLAGDLSSCLDHVPGGTTSGLVTVQTVSSTTGTNCAGSSITLSGRLATQSNGNYGRLSNISLASRTIFIDRKLHSTSTWTLDWSSMTTTSATSGNNWTRAFTENPGITMAYDYRVHFKGIASTMAASYSGVITLTFLKPCPPPVPARAEHPR